MQANTPQEARATDPAPSGNTTACTCSHRQLVAALDQIPEGILCTDPAGTLLWMNAAAARITGLDPQYAAGQLLAALLPGLADATDSGPFEFLARDGVRRMVRVKAVEADTAREDRLYIVADVTQQLDVESRIRHSQNMAVVGQLASGIAHDFNNTLSMIVGYADLLRSRLADEPALVPFVQNILRSAGEAADLTHRILGFSRRRPHPAAVINLHALLSEVTAMLERTIDRRIDVLVDLHAAQHMVRADGDLLHNIFLNLALNARDAMPQGGTLRIGTTGITLNAPSATYREPCQLGPGEYIRVDVSDTGAGIPDDVVRHLFEPFFTTKGSHGGLGLGLAAVYNALAEVGGAIYVTTSDGKGSVFSVVLPIDHPTAHPPPPPSDEPQSGSGCILLVDDEKLIREMLRVQLQELGYTVREAGDGEAAVAEFSSDPAGISLVVLDLAMPRMSGADTFRVLRTVRPDLPIILSSGFSYDADATEVTLDDFSTFVQKPYRMNVLLLAMERLLRESAAGKEPKPDER